MFRTVAVVLSAVTLSAVASASGPEKSAADRHASVSSPRGYISTFVDVIPHIAFGGTWTTKFTIINFRTTAATVGVYFTDDSGTRLTLPLVGLGTASSLDAQLPSLGKVTFETEYLPTSAEGWGMGRLDIPCDSLDACGNIGGFAVFKHHVSGLPDQEAVVPFTSSQEQRSFVSFDNQNGYFTGVAVTYPKFISTSATYITVIARDASGSRLMMDQILLNADGHTAFLVADKYPELAGKQGTIEFSTTDYVAVLGLVFNPTGAFTTSPSFQVN